jgi:hypothetical protein
MTWFRKMKPAAGQPLGLSLDEIRAQIALTVSSAEARIDAIHARLLRAEAEHSSEEPKP